MYGSSFFILLILRSLSFVMPSFYSLHHGILKVQETSSDVNNKFCYLYYSDLGKIPINENDIILQNISNIYSMDLCEENPPPSIQGTIAIANEADNCSLIKRAIEIEATGGLGSIFVGTGFKSHVNSSNLTNLNIGFISNRSFQSILEMGQVIGGAYSSVDSSEFFMYYTLMTIWVMAEFSIVVGSFWSGIYRNRLHLIEQENLKELRHVGPSAPQNAVCGAIEKSSMNLSPKIIILMVSLMCVFLVGLWALLDYLVYFIIGLFCFATTMALYCCFEPLILKIPCGRCRTPYFNLYFMKGVIEVRQIFLLLSAISLVIVWVIFRKEPFAWILQDFLGIAFCINIMVRVRLPNLMICTLFLCLLVLYDLFFVFITPFITSSGTSIMVDVAKGATEELPMLFKVPYFIYPEVYDVCKIRNFSLLGLGDVVVPGLMISFVHSFDLKVGTPCRLYFIINVISYGCGLLLTFVCLFVMHTAQPALFYLVPAILFPTVIVAAARGELAAMWTNRDVKGKSPDLTAEEHGQIDDPAIEGPTESPYLGSTNNSHSEALLDNTEEDDHSKYDNNSLISDNKSSCTNSSTEVLNKKSPDEN